MGAPELNGTAAPGTTVGFGTAMPELLLLADGRFPSGGHAHSGGLEAAAALEGVRDVPHLESFLTGRLATAGVVAAAFTAASCVAAIHGADDRLATLDEECAARTPSPVLRTASRRLGRGLLRAGRTAWPDAAAVPFPAAPGRGPHQPIALGTVAAAAGLGAGEAALASAHDAVLGPATAAVRLLGIDPFAVHALVARLGPQISAVAADAAGHADADPAELPSHAAPLQDVAAEHHATWEVRLFAS